MPELLIWLTFSSLAKVKLESSSQTISTFTLCVSCGHQPWSWVWVAPTHLLVDLAVLGAAFVLRDGALKRVALNT